MAQNPLAGPTAEEIANFHENSTHGNTFLYMLYDQALKLFVMPHVCRTPGEAERDFKMGAKNPKSGHLFENTEHFNLYECAAINTKSGIVTTYSAPRLIIQGQQVKAALTDEERQLRIQQVQ